MQFALLIYESPEAFATRNKDSYVGAWRAYHKALVEAGIFVGGDPSPTAKETGKLQSGLKGKENAACRTVLTPIPRSN